VKLYLWREVLSEYTDGCAFAIAETEEEAKEQLRNTFEFADPWGQWSPFAEPGFYWPEPEVHELTEPFGFWRYGGG
jgi:hypothetical protein